MQQTTNQNTPTNQKNCGGIINKPQKFIRKIIILRKNKLQKNTPFVKNNRITEKHKKINYFLKLYTFCEIVVETPPTNSFTKEFALIKT